MPVDAELKGHLERRLQFALGGLGDEVQKVVVRLSAESTPARPLGRCEIEVVLQPRSVRVAETGDDMFAAVENAADRLRRAVARARERERAWASAVPLVGTRKK